MVLKLSQKSDSILSDLQATFIDGMDEWVLEGHPEGYTKEKAYVKVPIKGTIIKMFSGMEISEHPSKDFEAVSRKEIRQIWKHLVETHNFILVSQRL